MARQPGPNDFHFESGVMMPGLGDDEPNEMTRERIIKDAEENAEREAAILRASAELAKEADTLERTKEDLDAREAALEARERALREAVGESSASNIDQTAQRRATAKQATERA